MPKRKPDVDLSQIDGKSRRHVKRILPLLQKINAMAGSMSHMTDIGLTAITDDLRERARAGIPLDDLLPEAFAAVREASKRAIGLYPHDVQVIGAILLHMGRVVEMRTGEGKTLAAAMPAYLNALSGKPVHIVTVNEYLAQKGADDIGPIYAMLGLSCEAVAHSMDADARRTAYASDITYVTNSEIGFDYLRDNMALHASDRVLRGLGYAIIDEADSVLIDEARTPLIISGSKGEPEVLYRKCDNAVRHLADGGPAPELDRVAAVSGTTSTERGDYMYIEKDRNVFLTQAGMRRVEKALGIKNYADPKNARLRHHVQMALQAHALYERDRDYVVRNGEAIIVDQSTGRMLDGRRYSDGLHQAIEAKEHLSIKPETQTMASVTYQSLFNLYEKKSGMTGTAVTSAREFKSIYGLMAIAVPTDRPVIRTDCHDEVYLTETAKFNAVIREIKACQKTGQPVLVGTTDVAKSELLSNMLFDEGVPHRVLNAKHHTREAQVIAHAGEKGSVTIATNMAGRGTDIKLGQGVAELGGLYVIGTERHEARRIDDQLRGRAGRQGDPGKSKFMLSMDDKVMRLFGSDRMADMLRAVGAAENAPIRHPSIDRMVDGAQRKFEDMNFGIRKSLMDFDSVDEEQRELIYAQREAILAKSNPDRFIEALVEDEAIHIAMRSFQVKNPENAFRKAWATIFPEPVPFTQDKRQMVKTAAEAAVRQYKAHVNKFPLMWEVRDMERHVMLRCIDWNWIKHLNELERIRQSVGFMGYGQRNPVLAYREMAYAAFGRMLDEDRSGIAKLVFRTKPHEDGKL